MKDVFTHGKGPFVTPLLARFVGLSMAEGPGRCVLEFQFEDGATLTIPIANPAAFALSEILAVYCAKRQAHPSSTN